MVRHLPFDDWVAHVFDHPAADPDWYFDLDAPVWDAPAELTLTYLTRLFTDPLPHLRRYDDRQLNQGFWYVVSNGGSNHMFALTDASAPADLRITCLKSFVPLFEQLFATRCSEHLSHLDQPSANPLNSACYMWWDLIPLYGAPDDNSRRDLDATALSVMEAILSIDSTACRESALHGLGHWRSCYPSRVEEIIRRALRIARGWPPELTRYAQSALSGCVL